MVIEVETKACDVCGKPGEVRDGKTCELGGFSAVPVSAAAPCPNLGSIALSATPR